MKILERGVSAQCLSFCVLLFLFVSACKKPEDIGLAILPQSDLLSATHIDSCTIESITLREDSLRADELSKMLLGSYVDPDFGISQADIYTQILLGVTPNLDSDPLHTLVADSVVLALAYSGTYGPDTAFQQTVHVYKLTQDLFVDSTYYTNNTFTDSTSFDYANNFQFQPRPFDSVMVGTVKQPAQLRIKLDQSFADSLVAWNNSTQYQNNDNWRVFFKGFHIKVDSAPGAILYFNPNSGYTKMTLYYHEISTIDTVYKTYDFLLDGARVNHQAHNFTGYPAGNQLDDSTVNDSLNYLQSMAGLRVKIKFPYLSNLKDSGNVIINKAELIVKQAANTSGTYAVPSEVFLSAFDSTGKINFVIDYFEGNFGGTFNVSDNTYKFNVTRQLQQIIDGRIADYGFSLNILSSGVQANRIIIGSGKGTTSKMKLNLYYTKLRQ